MMQEQRQQWMKDLEVVAFAHGNNARLTQSIHNLHALLADPNVVITRWQEPPGDMSTLPEFIVYQMGNGAVGMGNIIPFDARLILPITLPEDRP